MILTSKRTSTEGTQMPLDALTLLPLACDLSDDGGLVDRSARTLTLGGGYCNNIAFFHLSDTSVMNRDFRGL
jgi:hypothetical protein